MDEEPEEDHGYVTLVNAKRENGELVECKERTGLWAGSILTATVH